MTDRFDPEPWILGACALAIVHGLAARAIRVFPRRVTPNNLALPMVPLLVPRPEPRPNPRSPRPPSTNRGEPVTSPNDQVRSDANARTVGDVRRALRRIGGSYVATFSPVRLSDVGERGARQAAGVPLELDHVPARATAERGIGFWAHFVLDGLIDGPITASVHSSATSSAASSSSTPGPGGSSPTTLTTPRCSVGRCAATLAPSDVSPFRFDASCCLWAGAPRSCWPASGARERSSSAVASYSPWSTRRPSAPPVPGSRSSPIVSSATSRPIIRGPAGEWRDLGKWFTA